MTARPRDQYRASTRRLGRADDIAHRWLDPYINATVRGHHLPLWGRVQLWQHYLCDFYEDQVQSADDRAEVVSLRAALAEARADAEIARGETITFTDTAAALEWLDTSTSTVPVEWVGSDVDPDAFGAAGYLLRPPHPCGDPGCTENHGEAETDR